MARARKGSDSGKAGKGPPAGSVDNLHKRIESEQISDHIAAFEKSGGRVEKLGVTRMLHKIAPEPKSEPKPKTKAAGEAKPAAAAPATAKPRGRPPKR
jgi:hypothetical protein